MTKPHRFWTSHPVTIVILALVMMYSGLSYSTGFDGATQRATHVPANFNELTGPQDVVMMPTELLDPNPNSVRLRFTDPPLEADQISLDGINYTSLRLSGEGSTVEAGAPDLPRVTRLIMIGKTGNVAARILSQSYTVMNNMRISPRQILHGDEDYPLDGTVEEKAEYYNEDRWYPENIVEITTPATLRDVRFVVLSVSPVQYNPVRNEVRVYENIECVIENIGGIGENEIYVNPTSISPGFKKLYSTFENFRDSPLDELPVFPGSYLVICTNYSTITTQAQKLVDWYTSKGLNASYTTVASSSSSGSIRTLINTEYNNSNGQLEFVCLIGEPGESSSSNYNIETNYTQLDNYYGTLNGGGGENPDPVPDLAVGRISCNNATDLQSIVAKSINYKKTPYTGDANWFASAHCTAHTNYIHSNPSTKEYTRQIMLQNGINVPAVQVLGGGISSSQVNSILNSDISVFNHRMSWISEMTNSDLSSAPTNPALPFVMSFTCGTGSFAGSGATLSEEWLHPPNQTVTQPKGAIGCIGLSGTGTHVPYNNIVDAGAMYGIYALGIEEQGIINIAGKLELYKNYQSFRPGSVQNFCYWANLMGDPAVQIWRKIPNEVTATMPSTINRGTNHVSIDLATVALTPVEDALVCLTKGTGASETFSRGYTDATGQIDLPCSTPTTGYVYVTITKDDVLTVIDSIQVVNSAASLSLNTVAVDDDNSGGTSGNNDDIPNPGETIDLNINITNSGTSSTITGISGTLSTDAPGITLVSATRSYPNLSTGSSANPTSPFRIQVSSVFNGETFALYLDLTSSAGSHELRIDLTPEAGDVTYVSNIFLGPGGNLNPGESGDFEITFQNSGDVTLVSPSALLRSLDYRVTVGDSLGSYGSVNPSTSATNTANHFNITISSGMFNGHQTEMELVIEDADGFRDSTRFFVTIGAFTSTSPSGPDAYGYYAFDNTETQPATAACTYEWVEIAPSQGGSGTSLGFNDQVEDADQSSVVTLPFSFEFYGQAFSQITICTNGWIAFGSYPTIDDFRNYRMGTPLGPPNQVAAFWDDLEAFGTSNNVYRYYDTVDHRYIIEWRARTLWSNQNEFFQIILFDPNYYPSATGNGKIKFQYQVFNLTSNSASNDNDYFSVGIQDEDHSTGLDYAFWNSYGPGAASLTAGRAIMFTTDATGQLNPSLEVSDPNGAEIWNIGQDYNILWQSTAIIGGIDIHINRSYPGGAWETLFTNTSNDNVQLWTVSGPATTNARVRIVSNAQPTVGDTSDANFTVRMPTVSVTDPNGGEILSTGEVYQIEWTSDGLGSAAVELNRDYPSGGWELLSPDAAGRFDWTVTGPPTSNARIRVSGVAVPTASDISDGDFTIGLPPEVIHKPLADLAAGTAVFVAKITDDIGGFTTKLYYREIGAGNFDSLAFSATGNPDEYSVSVALGAGEYEYYVQTVDAQDFVVRVPAAETYAFEVGLICDAWITYDDGSSENYNWVDGDGFKWAVYFDPGNYPFTICSGRFAINPTNPTDLHGPSLFIIQLADGPSGSPGTVIYEDTTGSVNAVGGLPAGAAWTEVIIGDGSSLVASGPFYVSVGNIEPRDCPVAYALDTSTPSGNSFVYDACDDLWLNESDAHENTRSGNRMIRISGQSLQPPEIVIQSSGNDAILTWISTGAPYYKVYSSANSDGPFSNFLGSTSSTTFTDVGIVGTNEIRFYQVLSSSTP